MNEEDKNPEEPKAEEPKAEEPKAEEPVAEEPKAEEPVAEEPKAEEPVAEEPKAEEPVAEEPKAEEPKAEEPKAEETKAEEPKSQNINYLDKLDSNEKIDSFRSGDTVVVNLLIREGERERIQAFQGNVIKGNHKNGSQIVPGKSFTVRRIASGVGVERTLPISSPSIDSLKVIRRGKVRRSNLYYLRDLTGKKARIKEAR